jgi:hypothetical protein
MKLLIATCFVGLGVALVAGVGGKHGADGQLDAIRTGSVATNDHYRLYVNGSPVECAFERLGAGRVRALGPECENMPHRIGEATNWIESGDASVRLALADGSVVMRLGMSDGAAYESFDPKTPLLLLKSEN